MFVRLGGNKYVQNTRIEVNNDTYGGLEMLGRHRHGEQRSTNIRKQLIHPL